MCCATGWRHLLGLRLSSTYTPTHRDTEIQTSSHTDMHTLHLHLHLHLHTLTHTHTLTHIYLTMHACVYAHFSVRTYDNLWSYIDKFSDAQNWRDQKSFAKSWLPQIVRTHFGQNVWTTPGASYFTMVKVNGQIGSDWNVNPIWDHHMHQWSRTNYLLVLLLLWSSLFTNGVAPSYTGSMPATFELMRIIL